MRRLLAFLFGIGTQLLFGFTVWQLFAFLSGHEPRGTARIAEWAGTNALLALQFAVPHSLLLHPRIRERLSRWITSPFYGCFYCVATCASLMVVFSFWKESSLLVWRAEGVVRLGIQGLFAASWIAMLHSLSLTGLGYQTGLTPWWDWLRGRPPRPRLFQPRSAYQVLRHPVYLSFLGLIWFTPTVTADRAVLIAVWTAYVFVGSWLKDHRLLYFLGDRYRSYLERVPGYPGMPFGPLARWSRPLLLSRPERPVERAKAA